ncbi:MAG: NusA-like transcription termination signal-binding factor [Sulfolobales archaeon]
MPEVKITSEELRYIALLQDLTGVSVNDCVVDEEGNSIIYIVSPGHAGLAVGKGGVNVKRLSKILGKRIEIVEYADNLEDLVRNIFLPARVLGTRLVTSLNGKKILYVTVDPKDKGIAIGKDGRNVTKAKLVLKRYYDIESVSIV